MTPLPMNGDLFDLEALLGAKAGPLAPPAAPAKRPLAPPRPPWQSATATADEQRLVAFVNRLTFAHLQADAGTTARPRHLRYEAPYTVWAFPMPPLLTLPALAALKRRVRALGGALALSVHLTGNGPVLHLDITFRA